MPRWSDIQKDLRGQVPSIRMRTASAFWDDFRARVPMYPQHALPQTRIATVMRWSLAATCAFLLLTGVTVHTWRGGADIVPNAITSLDIATPYRAVFIMNDKQSGSTILWIDCDAGGNAAPGGVL